MKNKKFIATILAVFLLFMVVGKYTRSRSLLSSNHVYATTVKDVETGEIYQYAVEMVSDNKAKVTKKNMETGETVYEEVYPATMSKNKITVPVPDEETQITFSSSQSLLPFDTTPTVTVKSDQYKAADNGKAVVIETPASSSKVSTSSQSSDMTTQSTSDSVSDASTSSSSKSSDKSSDSSDSTSSSNKNSDKTTKNDTSKTSSSSKSTQTSLSDSSASQTSKTETTDYSSLIANLSKDDTNEVIEKFGDWLYKSDYGQDAIVVRGKYNDIVNLGSTSTHFESLTTEDDTEILTRLIGIYNGKIPDGIRGYVGSEEVDRDRLLAYKDGFSVAMLGTDLSSLNAADYQATSAFRLYTRTDKKHEYYGETDETDDIVDEYEDLVDSSVPSSENYGATNNGYDYYYDNLVDHEKDSYQIILATDGKVYYVTDYFFDHSSGEKDVYKLAPDDMQEAYQKLIKEQSGNKSDTTQTEKETTQMDTEAIKNGDYSSVAGTWRNAIGEEYTFDAKGLVSSTYAISGLPEENSNDVVTAIVQPLKSPTGGFLMYFIPKGDSMSPLLPSGEEDKSDNSKDRLVAVQGNVSSSGTIDHTLYRVSD